MTSVMTDNMTTNYSSNVDNTGPHKPRKNYGDSNDKRSKYPDRSDGRKHYSKTNFNEESSGPSVLELDYVAPKRPYSQNELKNMRLKIYKDYRLGKTFARHSKCSHFYLVKENGRKYKDIQEQNNEDCGNCSVCWKINKTPKHLKNSAKNLVAEYDDLFRVEPTYLTYAKVDIEKCFYKWLCVEFSF